LKKNEIVKNAIVFLFDQFINNGAIEKKDIISSVNKFMIEEKTDKIEYIIKTPKKSVIPRSEKQKKLSEIYWKKLEITDNKTITTNKWLFNYQYAGIIAKAIPNAKIIHCYRNPLDNILSTYRAHFATGNNFSSSLVDSAKVYSDQDEIMRTYKKEFKNHIYSLNYDKLVTHPSDEIKSLIRWLGWSWNDLYLSPHLNKRKVSTRSNVQVRSPINTKSLGGWKNYKEMLKPAMEIITKIDKYKDLKY